MYESFGKRVLDVVLAGGAIVVLVPLLLIVALSIKVFDSGPIFFVQVRIGKGGQPFRFLKFRSMPVNTGDLPSDQLRAVRLTWVGRFIRRSNIDELPQLINIIRGDMSIVGPRPPIASQEELIATRKANGALECRPGLTGLAQVNAFDGMSVQVKAAYDGDYAARISFLSDLAVIFRTFAYLFREPPVY